MLVLVILPVLTNADSFDGQNVTLIETVDLTTLSVNIDPTGIWTNGTDSSPDTFWIVDNYGNIIYETDSSFSLRNSFNVNSEGLGNPDDITGNGSDFWVVDTVDDMVYHLNSTFKNLTSPFNTYDFDDDILGGNSTNLYLLDKATSKIGIYDLSGKNLYNISCSSGLDCDGVESIDGNGTDYWVIDSTSNGKLIQINSSGDSVAERRLANIGSGFVGGGNINSIVTTNGLDFWIIDASTDEVYHVHFNGGASPILNITEPQNVSYASTRTELNYTVSDDGELSSCWYSLDNGQTNTTVTCGNNVTGLDSGEGSFKWTIYANDTFGNENSYSVNFTVDLSGPSIVIDSPSNKTYIDLYSYNISLNVSVKDISGVDSMWYSLDNGLTNISFTENITISGLSPKDNKIIVYANDSVGNENSNYTYFYLSFTPKIYDIDITNSLYIDDFDSLRNTVNNWADYSFDIDSKNLVETYKQEIYSMNLTFVTNKSTDYTYGSFQSTINSDWSPYINGNLSFSIKFINYTKNISRILIKYGDNVDGAQQYNYTECVYYYPNWTTDNQWYNFTFYVNGSRNSFCDINGVMNWDNIKELRFNIEYNDDFDSENKTFDILMDDIKVTVKNEEPYLYKRSYLKEGLMGWWKLDENNTNQNDSSGNGNDGIVNGNAKFINNGRIGGAYEFPGIDFVGDVEIPTQNIGPSGTISFWIYFNEDRLDISPDNDYREVFQDGYTQFNRILWEEDNRLRWRLYNSEGGAYFSDLDSSYFEWGKWVFYAFVYDINAGIYRIYKNAELVKDIDNSYYWDTYTPRTPSGNGKIGGRDVQNHNGSIDEVRVYNRTLSSEEIKKLYYLTNPSLPEYANSTIRVNITDEDSDSNELYYKWYVDDVEKKSGYNENSFNYVYNLNNHKVKLEVTDKENNNLIQEWNITTLFVSPTIKFELPTPDNNSEQYSNSVVINVSGTEYNLDYAVLEFDNTDYTMNCNNDNAPYYSCYYNLDSLSEGNHNFTVYVYDIVGNSNKTEKRTFTVDRTAPTIIIDSPINLYTYSTNLSLELNYSVSDSLTSVSSCWYNLINSSGDILIDNTTITNCQNTTFNVSQGGGEYNLTLYSNDSVNNVNNKTVKFFISLGAPAVNLDYPNNNVWINHTENIYFNFTATDSNGIDTCELWGNWSGGWHKNYTWIGVQSGVMNYTILNLSDGSYVWNVWCNDTLNYGNFSFNNYTLNIDSTHPTATIVKPKSTDDFETDSLGKKTVTFEYIASDNNIDSCWYSVYNSENICQLVKCPTTITCGENTTFTTSGGDSFTLTLYVNDSANNLKETSVTFQTHLPVGGIAAGGGGGGTPTEEKVYILVLALIKPENYKYEINNKTRAILYSAIYKQCNGKLNCKISDDFIKKLKENLLKNYTIIMSNDNIKLWVNQYNNNAVEEVEIEKEIVDKYGLLKKTITVIKKEFSLTPPSLSRYWFYPIGGRIFKWDIKANKNIKKCEIEPGIFKINGNCSLLTNSTALINYELKEFKGISKVITGSVRFESIDGEVIYLPVRLIIYKSIIFLYLIILVLTVFILFFVWNKKYLNNLKSLL